MKIVLNSLKLEVNLIKIRLKLIAVIYTVMLNGYSQWLNTILMGEKLFYRNISSIDIRD